MLDPKEEAKFDELKAKCRELKVPAPPEIMIGLKVHEGGVLTFDDVQRGHSWTRNFWNAMCSHILDSNWTTNTNFGAGYISNKTVGGTTNDTYDQLFLQHGNFNSNFFYSSPINVARGLVVGTSDTAFGVEQYALGAIIPDGSTAGTLVHSAGAAVVMSYAAKVWKATYSRIYNNNSGGSITVKETGIYGSWSSVLSMLERSVLSPTVAVANGAQLTVTYEISMDFSAID
jgi:hypothetical protein